jgi:flagellar protein FliO/FliZ
MMACRARLFACVLAASVLAGAAQARQAPAAATDPAPTPTSAAPARASAPAPDPVSAPAPATGAGQPFAGAAAGSLLQTIFALCVVLGLLALFAWAMKRYGPRAMGGSAHIRMVGGLNLGGRERIIVVEVGGQWIVVGASPGRVNALATMPKQGDGQAGAGAELHPHQPTAPNFAAWLKQTLDRRNGDAGNRPSSNGD